MFTFNKVGLVTHRVHVLWLQVILNGKNVSQDQVRKYMAFSQSQYISR